MVLLLAGTTPLAQPAFAGAWAMPEGKQQWSATVSRESGDFGQAWRADDYTEMGLGDGGAITTKIESEIRIGDTYDDRSGFKVGLQKAFALGDRASFSVLASFIGGEAMDGPECLGEGYEARAALGTSFSFFGREGFVNGEIAHRSRSGGCERSGAEIATGLEFAPDWNLGFKAWSDQGQGGKSTKIETGISRDFGKFSVGAGWREEVSGDFKEKGWVLTARAGF